MGVKEVIKQDNMINLYHLNFLVTVLRPVLVILGGGTWDDSPT
jgi:hypothetical protein